MVMNSTEVKTNLNVALILSEGLFRDGLCSLLHSMNHNLVAVDDSLALLKEKYKSIKPDVVIVECDIAKEEENCLRLLITEHEAKVAIICQKIDDKTFIADVKMGISCLCYKEPSNTLLDELKLISQGEAVISKGILTGIEGEDKERGILVEGLTRREAEVFCYIGKGYSNKEIGEKLYISENTIKGHVHSILSKLSLKNRREIAAYALKRGIDISL